MIMEVESGILELIVMNISKAWLVKKKCPAIAEQR